MLRAAVGQASQCLALRAHAAASRAGSIRGASASGSRQDDEQGKDAGDPLRDNHRTQAAADAAQELLGAAQDSVSGV